MGVGKFQHFKLFSLRSRLRSRNYSRPWGYLFKCRASTTISLRESLSKRFARLQLVPSEFCSSLPRTLTLHFSPLLKFWILSAERVYREALEEERGTESCAKRETEELWGLDDKISARFLFLIPHGKAVKQGQGNINWVMFADVIFWNYFWPCSEVSTGQEDGWSWNRRHAEISHPRLPSFSLGCN